jgi:nucleotide-binding universal stress UspA family protein
MLDALWRQYYAARRRLRRLSRREAHEIRRWLEDTENFLHLSTLLVVPLVIGVITWVSNVSPVVSFLIYPPLASGTYALFTDPGGPYADPITFVGGITAGAVSGLVAFRVTVPFVYPTQPGVFEVYAGTAALGIFLTSILTWTLGLEVPTAFSTALLVLVTGSSDLTYVIGIIISSVIVAGAFVGWRRYFYQERSRYLFRSTSGDDHVLVPTHEETPDAIGLFAARLAVAHTSGKVILMEAVSESAIEEATAPDDDALSREVSSNTGSNVADTESVGATAADTTGSTDADATASADAESAVTAAALERLERRRNQITGAVSVPCEYVVAVAADDPGETVVDTAHAENCDLICAPYEADDDALAAHTKTLLTGDVDTIVFRPARERTEWHRVLVMVRTSGEIANAMMEFAKRLASPGGVISACSVISDERERRHAEIVLEDVVDSLSVPVETRIGYGTVPEFLEQNAAAYDVVFVGASTDRPAASRLVSTPTYERIRELDCDLAIVHRG